MATVLMVREAAIPIPHHKHVPPDIQTQPYPSPRPQFLPA